MDTSQVPYDREVVIYDAREDLSTVGYSFRHWNNQAEEHPIVILRGRAQKFPLSIGGVWSLQWYPFRITKEDGVVLSRALSEHPEAYRLANLRTKQMHIIAKRSVPPSRCLPAATSISTEFPEAWWHYRYPNPENLGPHSDDPPYSFRAELFKSNGGFQLGSIAYLEGPSDTADPYTHFYFPILLQNGKMQPLRDCVVNASGLDLSQVQFVSPKGWLVVNARRNGHTGLAWLYPVRSLK